MKRMLALVVFCAALAAVVVGGSHHSSARAASLAPVSRVILIMEENHSASAAYSGMPYLRGLSTRYAKVSGYHAITHPSLPNYIALSSGSTSGFDGKDCQATSGCVTGRDNIFHQTPAWQVWAESMPKPCDHQNAGAYAARHTMAPYYTDLNATCPQRDIPLSLGHVPGLLHQHFIEVTPNLNHDAHDGSLATADAWLKKLMATLTARPRFTDGSTLIEITFDEGSHSDNSVAMVMVNPRFHGKTVSGSYNHYSLLRLNEELLGNKLLGHAAGAPDLRGKLGL